MSGDNLARGSGAKPKVSTGDKLPSVGYPGSLFQHGDKEHTTASGLPISQPRSVQARLSVDAIKTNLSDDEPDTFSEAVEHAGDHKRTYEAAAPPRARTTPDAVASTASAVASILSVDAMSRHTKRRDDKVQVDNTKAIAALSQDIQALRNEVNYLVSLVKELKSDLTILKESSARFTSAVTPSRVATHTYDASRWQGNN